MKYFDNINNHKYIYLGDIGEPEDNVLRFTIEEAGVSDEETTIEISGSELSGLRSIEVTDKSCIYEITFDSYISYSVLNESYCGVDDYEEYDGRLFCVYKKSHYLNYVGKASLATSDYPGPFKHYGFNCLNHIVDVISTEEPSIKLLSGRHLIG
ncbi:hypothetical protein [Zhongshania sp. BJYM1]|uniref:hypothetical protein n=1 Tax=Zhongshania aquatica TaxID=2965069 RepID=UPI0022B4BE21|nr:hypothetical protein [Marortus sp. BJYM1]